MESISVFGDIKKATEIRWKYTDVSRTQGVCHTIYMFFVSFLGKVQLCQVS